MTYYGDDPPSSSRAMGAIYTENDSAYFALFGGESFEGNMNSLFILDIGKFTWTKV